MTTHSVAKRRAIVKAIQGSPAPLFLSYINFKTAARTDRELVALSLRSYAVKGRQVPAPLQHSRTVLYHYPFWSLAQLRAKLMRLRASAARGTRPPRSTPFYADAARALKSVTMLRNLFMSRAIYSRSSSRTLELHRSGMLHDNAAMARVLRPKTRRRV
jgi:hypothetical protein